MTYRLVAVLLLALVAPAGAGHPLPPSVPTIDAETLKRLLDEGTRPVSIDLRSPEDHRGGRIPGARSVPLEELRRRWMEVPRQRVVVLYCACPSQTIDVAYYFLRRQGYEEVFVLKDGLEAWTARGYPLER